MTDDQRSDSEILVSLPHEPELMGVLYERHAPAVFRYLARRAGPTAAEDLLSEVFIAALDARKRVVAHRSGSALPWLYGIAMNVLRRYFRRSQPAGAVEPSLGMDWDAVDARLDAEAQRRRLRTALCSLSEPDRELLLLVAWEGLTSAEAASVLGISNVAARSRLHRARHRALQALHGNGGLPVLTTRATRGEVFGSMIPINLGRNIFPAGAANLTWDQMYALPTDPAKLEPVLRSAIESAGPNATAELHSVVADLLPESPASPALREALYEVVANIPGVKLLGHYKDALGRTGTAVERDGETLVIDPNTGQLLADIQGNPSTGLSCGRGCVTYGVAYTYVSKGPASRAPAGR